MRDISRILLSATALAAASFSGAQATPISASLSVTGHAELDTVTADDPKTASWGTLLDPLNIAVDAQALDSTTNGFSEASASVDASWGVDGNSGSVLFNDYRLKAFEGGNNYEADLNSGGPDWQYTFTADTDASFSMTYNVVATTPTTDGLYGWDIGWSGPGGGGALQNALDPTTSGVFTRPVVAGLVYTISLDNNANISCACAFAPRAMNGEFSFEIAAAGVPEPATLALFGAGLVALGWMLHRRKKH